MNTGKPQKRRRNCYNKDSQRKASFLVLLEEKDGQIAGRQAKITQLELELNVLPPIEDSFNSIGNTKELDCLQESLEEYRTTVNTLQKRSQSSRKWTGRPGKHSEINAEKQALHAQLAVKVQELEEKRGLIEALTSELDETRNTIGASLEQKEQELATIRGEYFTHSTSKQKQLAGSYRPLSGT